MAHETSTARWAGGPSPADTQSCCRKGTDILLLASSSSLCRHAAEQSLNRSARSPDHKAPTAKAHVREHVEGVWSEPCTQDFVLAHSVAHVLAFSLLLFATVSRCRFLSLFLLVFFFLVLSPILPFFFLHETSSDGECARLPWHTRCMFNKLQVVVCITHCATSSDGECARLPWHTKCMFNKLQVVVGVTHCAWHD